MNTISRVNTLRADLSAEDAARICLAAQGLTGKLPPRADRRHLRRAMNTMQVLQLDSVSVVARTQQLVLWSRIGAFRHGLLEEIAYRDGELLEAWAHEASLVPVELEPLLRWRQQRTKAGETWKVLVRFAAENPKYVEEVLAQVEERGPIGVADLDEPRRGRGQWWGSRAGGTWALDWLYRIGALAVLRTERFDRRYDLYERVVPEAQRKVAAPPEHEAQRELLRRAAIALGLATARDLADYFRLSMKQARLRIAELIEAGSLVVRLVEGWREQGLAAAGSAAARGVVSATERRALLSPFDPVVWNRERARRIFGFDYVLEIYTPAHKRVHGYYVLPFLLGDRMAARLDCKADRKAGVLRVNAAFAEKHADRGATAVALAQELLALAQWLRLDRVVVGRRGDLCPALRVAVKAAGLP